MSRRDYNEWLGYLTGNLSQMSIDVLDNVESMGVQNMFSKAQIIQHVYGVVEIGEEVGLITAPTRLDSSSTFKEEVQNETLEAWKLYKDGERNLTPTNPLTQYGVTDLNSALEEFGVSEKLERMDSPEKKMQEAQKLKALSDELGLGYIDEELHLGEEGVENSNQTDLDLQEDEIEYLDMMGFGGRVGEKTTPLGSDDFLRSLKGLNTSESEGSVYVIEDPGFSNVTDEEDVDLDQYITPDGPESQWVNTDEMMDEFEHDEQGDLEEGYSEEGEDAENGEELIDLSAGGMNFFQMMGMPGAAGVPGVEEDEEGEEQVDWGAIYGSVSAKDESENDSEEEEQVDWGALYGLSGGTVEDTSEDEYEEEEETVDWGALYGLSGGGEDDDTSEDNAEGTADDDTEDEEQVDWGALYGMSGGGQDEEEPEEGDSNESRGGTEPGEVYPSQRGFDNSAEEDGGQPLIGYASDVEKGIFPREVVRSRPPQRENPLKGAESFRRSTEKELNSVARGLHSFGSRFLKKS